jgi:hypothetical protein
MGWVSGQKAGWHMGLGTLAVLRRFFLRALLVALVLLATTWELERRHILPHGSVSWLLRLDDGHRRHRQPRSPAYAHLPPVLPRDADRVDYGQLTVWLESIALAPEVRPGYHRDDWPHWLDTDADCRDTRTEVLIRDAVAPPRLSADGCRVVAGVWRDPYTGEAVDDPHRLDVDHRVALEEAHDSGGYAWDLERRTAYANDLSDPRTLVAVTAAVNHAKGARGPEEWLPPDPGNRCRYVADWVAVKARWRLTMDPREHDAITAVIADCRAHMTRLTTGLAPGASR